MLNYTFFTFQYFKFKIDSGCQKYSIYFDVSDVIKSRKVLVAKQIMESIEYKTIVKVYS